MERKCYVDATPESGENFYREFAGKGKIVLLNLLKFRKLADYSKWDHLKPQKEITGAAAYDIYMENTIPVLERFGSRVLYYGNSGDFVIGPEFEKWDSVLLVEHQSVKKFMEFSQDEKYLETAGHRSAALADARLLPSLRR